MMVYLAHLYIKSQMSKQSGSLDSAQQQYYQELFLNLKEKLNRVIQEDDPSSLNDLIEAFLDRLKSLKDYTIFSKCRLSQTINQVYSKYYHNIPACKSLLQLIGLSSKMKVIQNSYDINDRLLQVLDQIIDSHEVLPHALFAMSALVYLNQKNQKALGEKNVIRKIIETAEQRIDDLLLIEKACSFLSNLSYKSQENKDQLYECGAIDFQMKLLTYYSSTEQKHVLILKQILRAIGNCSSHASSIVKITELNYLSCIKPLVKQLTSQYFYLIKYMVDILSNLCLQGAKNKKILHKLFSDDVLKLIYELLDQHSMNTDFVCSCLDILIGVGNLPEALSKMLDSNFVELLIKIVKIQEWNKVVQGLIQNVVSKCIYCLEMLSEQKESIDQMVNLKVLNIISQILDRSSPQRSIFEKCYSLIRKIYNKKENIDGIVECIMSAYTYGNVIEQNEVQYLMWVINAMINKDILSSIMLQSLFQPVVMNMNKFFKSSQKVVKFGIEILKKVIGEITIQANNLKELVEFSCKFLTRINKLSYISYQIIVKNYLCLLARMLIKLPLLKIELSSSVFLTILQSWLKISPVIEVQSMKQALDLCFFILLGTKKLPHQKLQFEHSKAYLSAPNPCYLYRKNKTNKLAEIQVIFNTKLQESKLVAYKQNSKRHLKDKYTLSLKNILAVTFNYEQNQNLLQKSVFFQSGGIFAKPPLISNCATISGTQDDSPRHLNLQFKDKETKMTFLSHLKNLMYTMENQ